jgi:hypothetical protein
MDSLTRQYYERNLGAGMFVSRETENGLVGYSEPLRRFIQHEGLFSREKWRFWPSH